MGSSREITGNLPGTCYRGRRSHVCENGLKITVTKSFLEAHQPDPALGNGALGDFLTGASLPVLCLAQVIHTQDSESLLHEP